MSFLIIWIYSIVSTYLKKVNIIETQIRKAILNDLPELELIREEAFTPVFASFKKILGNEIYDIAQKHEDEEQSKLLPKMLEIESNWELFTIEFKTLVIGFISIKLDQKTRVGEIGLNAIKPSYSGKGIGTKMYKFANKYMKDAGMLVSTVSTGGDPSHEPARHAYEKVGFDVQIPSVWYCKIL